MYAESTQVLLSSLQSLQTTGDYSDLTIFCGNVSHRVHKAIVCPRSSFFAGAARFGEEALKNEVTLTEDDPEVVGLMIDYLYQLDYKIGKPERLEALLSSESGEQAFDFPPTPESPVARTIGMFEDLSGPSNMQEISDEGPRLGKKDKKYKKKSRKALCFDDDIAEAAVADPSLEEQGASASPTVKKDSREILVHAQVYSLADKYSILDLKEAAKDKFVRAVQEDWNDPGFLRAIQVVYTSTIETDTGLRKVVVETLENHRELLDKPEVEKCLKEVPDLAFDLVQALR